MVKGSCSKPSDALRIIILKFWYCDQRNGFVGAVAMLSLASVILATRVSFYGGLRKDHERP